MGLFSAETIYWVLFAIPSILIASTIHEYAHAWAAVKLGDLTPKMSGRLTLNPISHIDPIGALSMILLRFGWSKPVPINEHNFENREIGTAITSIAGPLSNIFTLLLTALIHFLVKPYAPDIALTFLITFAMINLVLAVFNLIPIPPLDGHKIVRAILPRSIRYYWEELEKFSILLIILLIIPVFPFGSIASLIISSILGKTLTVLGFF